MADTPSGEAAGAAVPGTEVGSYRVLEPLGEGGMGVVYAAEDLRLGRRVALKLLKADAADTQAHERLMREARIAARVSHPLVCQVFELGEWRGRPFVAMELLAGESLAAKVARGALPSGEAISIALSVLDALAVLHAQGIVHRDLKPSNVFLTPHGIKLLDFGLARPLATPSLETLPVTQGVFIGTPKYAAPEQLLGGDVDARADLFAAGVILFEMLAGQPPFGGGTLAALVHAVVHDAPAVLTGSATVAAADRILCRALAKRPDQRYASANAFASDLKAVLQLGDGMQIAEARRILRLAVLPFRLLRPEPEFEYLGIGLADALVSSLSGLQALVVRSALRSARYAGTVPDLGTVASELSVDLVVTGSLLRVRDGFRVTAELLTAPAGDSLWRGSLLTSPDEVFDRQDEIARGVLGALPLTPSDRSRTTAPHAVSPKAYDLYLRGMQLRMESGSWRQARALFDQSVAVDAGFAAGWAERGRITRVLSKYAEPALMADAEASLQQALAIDPQCAAAHHYYAQLEIDLGRLDAAFARLLRRVRERRAEPQAYAALVQACRYAGLLDESLAAHEQAFRLDESVPTSVLHTYYMRGEYDRIVDEGHRSSDSIVALALGALGRTSDAIAWATREEERFAAFPVMRSFTASHRAALEGRADEVLAAAQLIQAAGFTDGEGLFYVAGRLASVGHLTEAAAMLGRAIDAGFLCLPALERDPFLAPLRASGAADPIVARLRSTRSGVLATFEAEGGPTLLGAGSART